MTNEELAKRFKALSFEQGENLDTPKLYSSAYEKLKVIGEELRHRGPAASRVLLPLLETPGDDGKFVFLSSIAQCRFNVAWELLSIAPERARATLQDLAANGPTYQRILAAGALEGHGDGSVKRASVLK